VFIGLSPYDNNQQINNFKSQFGVGYACAGNEGGGPEAIAIVIEGQGFFGYPSYSVVCPDKKLNFSVCFPPTPECFDPYFENCSPSTAVEVVDDQNHLSIYPNPASDMVWIDLKLAGEANVQLVNMQGKSIREFHFDNDLKAGLGIDVSGLAKGLYIISVRTKHAVYSRKLQVR